MRPLLAVALLLGCSSGGGNHTTADFAGARDLAPADAGATADLAQGAPDLANGPDCPAQNPRTTPGACQTTGPNMFDCGPCPVPGEQCTYMNVAIVTSCACDDLGELHCTAS